MGLFSSKKKIYVGTQVTRVVNDDLLPDAVRTGVTRAILQSSDITENVMEQLVGGLGMKADQMYAEAEQDYIYGMPSGEFVSINRGQAEVRQILETMEGQPVELEYSRLGPPNPYHLAWLELQNAYGYNSVTNRLPGLDASIGNAATYLQDMVLHIPRDLKDLYDPITLSDWGTPANAGPTPRRFDARTEFGSTRAPTPMVYDLAGTAEFIRVEYVYWINDEWRTTLLDIQVDPMADESLDYFQVRYTVGGVSKWWMYQAGAGTYPQLDALLNITPTPAGSFYPFLYFRFGAQAENADVTTKGYKDSKRLAKFFGMKYDKVADAINENPDIDNVQQAFMTMAVPAVSADPIERRYLWQFFNNLFVAQGGDGRYTPIASWLSRTLIDPQVQDNSAIVIQDQRFKMVLRTGGIYKRKVAGSIGVVGSYDSSLEEITVNISATDPETGQEILVPFRDQYHSYRKQVSPGVYEEIRVLGLEMMYFIYGDHFSTGTGDAPIVLIPLDRTITQTYTIREREKLYARSMHMVFNSMQEVSIKWYQDSFFQFILVVVAVFATVASFGSDGGSTLMAAIAAGDAVAISTALMALLENLLVKLVVGEVVKLFVKAVGGDIALVLAAALAVYAGFSKFAVNGLPGAPFATQLLDVATTLFKGVGGYYADAMGELGDEFGELREKKELAENELERANALLENSNNLSPFVIFGESPTDFYNRTVHSGNIGINGIGAISSFVDTALRLPSMAETLGEI